MVEFRKHGVYIKVSEDQCWMETGKGPIGVRWIDVNKGDEDNPDYRSRLVAQEIKMDKREDLYSLVFLCVGFVIASVVFVFPCMFFV